MNYVPGQETKIRGKKVIPIRSHYCILASGIPCEFRKHPCTNIRCGSFMFLNESNYAKYLVHRLIGQTS